eukprot:4099622-Pleurochrysis_carterae.AAC.1
MQQHLVVGDQLGGLWGWRAEGALVEEDAVDTIRGRQACQVVVRSTCRRARSCPLLQSESQRHTTLEIRR